MIYLHKHNMSECHSHPFAQLALVWSMANDRNVNRSRRRRLHNAKHFVYEIWAEDECLYVGMSSDLITRLIAQARQPWYQHVTRIVANAVEGSRHDALRVEYETIDRLQPTFNIYGTAGREVVVVPRSAI